MRISIVRSSAQESAPSRSRDLAAFIAWVGKPLVVRTKLDLKRSIGVFRARSIVNREFRTAPFTPSVILFIHGPSAIAVHHWRLWVQFQSASAACTAEDPEWGFWSLSPLLHLRWFDARLSSLTGGLDRHTRIR